MSRARNALVATGLLIFAGAGLSFPFLFVKSKNKPIIDSSKPLPPQATFRGPYVNTGSRDIGPDPTNYPKKDYSGIYGRNTESIDLSDHVINFGTRE